MKDKFDKKSTPEELKYQDLDPAGKRLVEQAVSRGYSRREVLKLMMATAVAIQRQ